MTLNGSMDSLLKEIDDEMEQAAAPDWKLPLHDIGDETMEMLVTHNTMENRHLGIEKHNSRKIIGSETSSPSKKSVGFSDGVELHEYSMGPEETNHEEDSNTVETRWIRSRPTKPAPLPSTPMMEESEAESEHEEEPQLTIGELRQHSVTDMGERLSQVLDSKPNMYKLKLMAEEVDNRATQPEENTRREVFNFTLQPTPPLAPDASNYNTPAQLTQFKRPQSQHEEEDEEDDETQPENLAQSPSKIPLTNTVSINNFNLENVNGYLTTRVSSGSSYAESASDLETTTGHDRFKLLEYSSDIPLELQYQSRNTDKCRFGPSKITNHPNASTAYSLGTEYESARETPNSSVTDLASEIRDMSVENLGIPGGLRECSPGFNDSSDSELQQGDDTLREEDLKKKNPALPELPVEEIVDAERHTSVDSIEKHNQVQAEIDDRDGSRNGIEYAGLHDISSSYGSLHARHEDDTVNDKEQSFCQPGFYDISSSHGSLHTDQEDQSADENNESIHQTGLHDISSSYESSHAGQEDATADDSDGVIPQAEWSSLTEELNASVNATENLGVSGSGSQESFESVKQRKMEKTPPLRARGANIPPLVPSVEPEPIFNEDPFEEIFDTSGDSFDLTRSVKPSDYISIWHNQAGSLKSNSPVFSTNSQFSHRSVSTESSTASVGRSNFKFKSRIISRCKYYNRDNRMIIPSDSEDDDDVIYVVDHAMDPKRRNTLISKQVRNNIRQNKKMNPIRAAAVNLHSQEFMKQEEDVPLENYRPTLAPSETLQLLAPPLEGKDSDGTPTMDQSQRKEKRLVSEIYEFGSYEHLAAIATNLDAEHESSALKYEDSVPCIEEVKEESCSPISPPSPPKYTPPITVPPRNAHRDKSLPVLSPPPRNINRKIQTLAPSPTISNNVKVANLPSEIQEHDVLAEESFVNEFESPPAPLIKHRSPRRYSSSSSRSEENIAAQTPVSNALDVSPSLPGEKLDEDFGTFLETLNRDDRSVQNSIKTKEGGYNIWNEEFDLTNAAARKSSIPSEVLTKLLETESAVEDPDDDQSGNSDSSQRYIKTPTDDVCIGRGLSVNGLEAVVSNGEASERNSVLFDEFHNSSIYKTPNHSPIRRTHVESPFKPISPSKTPKAAKSTEKREEAHVDKNKAIVTPKSTESELELEPDSKLEPIFQAGTRSTAQEEEEYEISELSSIKHNLKALQPQDGLSGRPLSSGQKTVKQKVPGEILQGKEIPEDTEFPNAGNLYLMLKSISGIKLRGVKRHKAQYAIEFDNGKNVAQTPWEPITDGTLKLNKEFEMVLDRKPNHRSKIVITLKCRYEKICYEPVVEEIVEKVPVFSKKKLFGKRKEQYEYQKKYIRKPPKQDDWDFIFARDGSFGRCELVLDEDFLDHARFQCQTISLDLKNEWARQHGAPHKKPHQLPRKPPHFIGQLKIDTCYLARSSALEKFPKTLAIARGIMSKYKAQQNISMEGYLFQNGGDVSENITRRFFKLKGNQLTGYHEVTKKAKIIINLLKVIEVVGPSDDSGFSESELMKQQNGFQGCFHLVFANGESITFDTEFSTDEKYDWFRKVKRVVDLNKSHQPWVKAFYENSIINNV
ncbi:uncharacterized protein ZBAI_08304 [Zygosaccharomyces bailii ISA1307]|nr:uncharacterized protein ZBAI_08304 [Zygosaccharomyces bailii ISA1307]